MATATQSGETQFSRSSGGREYVCACGHAMRVYGVGRHQVYFERDDDAFDHPAIDRVCPLCRRGLPGKNRA